MSEGMKESHRASKTWTKADLINHVAAVHGYRNYLELCTCESGFLYAAVDRSRLVCRRLMYRCHETYDDGMATDFRSPDLDISQCLAQMTEARLRFDVVFVDAWHEYETSRRDLNAAFALVSEGGTVIVHDCLPPHEDLAQPRRNGRLWCGVTYKAYLDFVTGREDLIYETVDIDFGCGVIRKLDPASPLRRPPVTNPETPALIERWRRIGDDYRSALRFFQANQRALLNLKSIAEFLRSSPR